MPYKNIEFVTKSVVQAADWSRENLIHHFTHYIHDLRRTGTARGTRNTRQYWGVLCGVPLPAQWKAH